MTSRHPRFGPQEAIGLLALAASGVVLPALVFYSTGMALGPALRAATKVFVGVGILGVVFVVLAALGVIE